MTDTLKISQYEHGVIRVFNVDLPKSDIGPFLEVTTDDQNSEIWPVQAALGATYLDGDHLDLIDVADLDDLGLAGFLIEGHGIDPAEIEPMRPQLAQLTGHVLILTSGAVAQVDQVLTPKSPLRLIAQFRENTPPVNFEPLPNPDPAAVLDAPSSKKKPSDAAMGGRVATVALLVMALLVWAMIKIAG